MSEQTLYHVLGLPQEATPEQIHKAYRKISMTAHPDHGGNPQTWAEVKHAHDVLMDEKRRATYDATGEHADQKAAQSITAAAISLLDRAIDETIDAFEKTGARPEITPFIQVLAARVKDFRWQTKEDIEHRRRSNKLMTALAERTKSKTEDNPIVAVLKYKISLNTNVIAAAEQHLEVIAHLQGMLANQTYRTVEEELREQMSGQLMLQQALYNQLYQGGT